MNTPLPPQYVATLPSNTVQADLLTIDESTLSRNDVGARLKEAALRYRLNQSVRDDEAQQVVVGVEVQDLQSGRFLYDHNQDAVHFAASINKLAITLLVLQDLRSGQLSMDQVLAWTAADQRAGAGVYDQSGAPTQATIRDLLFDMLNSSGNTAVRVLVNQALGGAAAVNNRLAQIPQIPNTRLQPLDGNRFFVGNTTTKEALWILEQLMAQNDSYQQFVRHALATNIYTDISVRSQLAGNDYIVLVNKVGLLDDPDGNNRHDVGIIYNTRTHKSYGYSLMTTSPFTSTTATPQAEQSLKDMGRSILRFSGDKAHGQLQPLQAPAHREAEGRIVY